MTEQRKHTNILYYERVVSGKEESENPSYVSGNRNSGVAEHHDFPVVFVIHNTSAPTNNLLLTSYEHHWRGKDLCQRTNMRMSNNCTKGERELV